MKTVISFVLLAGLVVCNVGWGQNLLNDPGFEVPGTWTVEDHAGYADWARRSGTNAFALYGWDSLAFGGCYQNVDVMMGAPTVYTFAVYVRCERNFNPSLLLLRLEGYGLDGITKTETDGIGDWSWVPRDGFWHHLFVSKDYTNSATAFVRPVIYSEWSGSGIGDEGVMIDDAALYVGIYTGSPEILNTGFEIGNHENWRGA